MPKIYDRLVSQLRRRKVKNPYAAAQAILEKDGIFKKGTRTLTAKGRRRNAMTPAQRAKSRAARRSGRSTRSYKYNSKTNRATLRRKKRRRK